MMAKTNDGDQTVCASCGVRADGKRRFTPSSVWPVVGSVPPEAIVCLRCNRAVKKEKQRLAAHRASIRRQQLGKPFDLQADLRVAQHLEVYFRTKSRQYPKEMEASYTYRDLETFAATLCEDLQQLAEVPSPSEIRQRCAEVRATWTSAQLSTRVGRPFTLTQQQQRVVVHSLPKSVLEQLEAPSVDE